MTTKQAVQRVYSADSKEEMAALIDNAMDVIDGKFYLGEIKEETVHEAYKKLRSAKRHMEIRLSAREQHYRQRMLKLAEEGI